MPILYYNYRCHIRHYDDPNLRKIIQLHIQVCEEIGNRECLPVEGDLITLAFECKGEEQFFYDWLNEGAMHNGEIHFIYNEVEIADIFRFWDCSASCDTLSRGWDIPILPCFPVSRR